MDMDTCSHGDQPPLQCFLLVCRSQRDVAMTLQLRGSVNLHMEQRNHLVLPEALPQDRNQRVCTHEEDPPVQWQQSVAARRKVHQIASVAS